jgi:MrfA Zn-binding domain
VFASGNSVIGENEPDSLLFAETLPHTSWDPESDPLVGSIGNLVVVHRLREVSCLYGFTRFEAAPTAADGELEDVRLAVRGAPLSLGADWLPAVEQFGEGLFIHFESAAVDAWIERPPVKARARQLLSGFDLWERQHQTHLAYPGVGYTMLHGLSHALMAEISLECGYPASALKERIYALPGHSGLEPTSRYGVLIYTATAGNQGTLGGLVATAPNFVRILRAALQRLAVCSNDPICSDHEPASTADDRALHGAACHGCLLIAETSCEARNLFLDRSLLVETMAGRSAGFFRELDYEA